MKKFLCLLLALTIVLSLCACGASNLSPDEKLESYIIENGKESGGEYALACPDAVTLIENNEETIAAMQKSKGTVETEFKIVKNESGVMIELVDSAISGGIKMERYISIALDGTFTYRNVMIMNGADLGVSLEGEIPVETYNKETDPVITKTELAAGAKLTDAVKGLMKEYINLALECFENELAKEELNLTLADFGYAAYPATVEK